MGEALDKLLALAGSSLPPSQTAPGAKPVYDYRLRHTPSQTQQASPPLPPGVSIPTPAEVGKVTAQVRQARHGSEGTVSEQLTAAVSHLTAAATALANKTPIEALHRLRSAQTDIAAAHLAYNAAQLPTANVFSSTLDPAERSSAQAAMAQTMATRALYRKLGVGVGQLIDRIRRAFFHGQFPPGYPTGWGSQGGGGTAGLGAGGTGLTAVEISQPREALEQGMRGNWKDLLSGLLGLAGEEVEKPVKGYERVEHGKLEHVAPHTQVYGIDQLEQALGMKLEKTKGGYGTYVKSGDEAAGPLVHIGGTSLMGDAARAALAAKAGHGEYGEHNGYFWDSAGEKHWGYYGGAGLLVRTHGEDGKLRYLLQKRSWGVQHGGTWSTPGGAIDAPHGQVETPEAAAVREGEEEFGKALPPESTHVATHTKTWGTGKNSWSYHTVEYEVPKEFNPEGDGNIKGIHNTTWESSGYGWFTPGEMAKLPLHPGFQPTAEELGMPKGGGKIVPTPPPVPKWQKRPDMPDDYANGDRVTWKFKNQVVHGVVNGPTHEENHVQGKLPDAYDVTSDADGQKYSVKWGQLRLESVPKAAPAGQGQLTKSLKDSIAQVQAKNGVPSKGEKWTKGDRVSYYGKPGTVMALGPGNLAVKMDGGGVSTIARGSPGLRRKVGELAKDSGKAVGSERPAVGSRVYSTFDRKAGTVERHVRDDGLWAKFDDGSSQYFPQGSYHMLKPYDASKAAKPPSYKPKFGLAEQVYAHSLPFKDSAGGQGRIVDHDPATDEYTIRFPDGSTAKRYDGDISRIGS